MWMLLNVLLFVGSMPNIHNLRACRRPAYARALLVEAEFIGDLEAPTSENYTKMLILSSEAVHEDLEDIVIDLGDVELHLR